MSHRRVKSQNSLPMIITGLDNKPSTSSNVTVQNPSNRPSKQVNNCSVPHHKQLAKKLKHYESELAREKRLSAAKERAFKEDLEKLKDQLEQSVAEQRILQTNHENALRDINEELETLRKANLAYKQEVHTLKISNLQKEKAIGMLKGEISKSLTSNAKGRQEQIKVFQAEIVKLREQIAKFVKQERAYKEELDQINKLPKACLVCPEKDKVIRESLHAIKLRDMRLAEITKSAKSMTGTLAFQDLLIDRIEKNQQ